MIVLGVDPSSSATGLAWVDVHARPAIVIGAEVLRPKGDWKDAERLRDLLRQLTHAVVERHLMAELVVIEDPTDFPQLGKGRFAGGASVKVGAAYGACLAALSAVLVGVPIRTVPSQSWIPRLKGRQFTSHELGRATIRSWIGPNTLPDDALYAAGVAIVGAGRRQYHRA